MYQFIIFVAILLALMISEKWISSYKIGRKREQGSSESFETETESKNSIVFRKNPNIDEIITRMKYIRKYNKAVYGDLRTILKEILVLYYRKISGREVKYDDFATYKDKLSELYEEISLNLPFKYHQRLKYDINELNKALDEKMRLMTVQYSNAPLKTALMHPNYKINEGII